MCSVVSDLQMSSRLGGSPGWLGRRQVRWFGEVRSTGQDLRACPCIRVGMFLGQIPRVSKDWGFVELALSGSVCGRHLCGRECDWKYSLRGPGTLVWTQLRVKGVAPKLHFLAVTGDWELEAHGPPRGPM